MMLIPAKETLCPPEELAERIRSHAKTLRGKYAAVAKEHLLQEAQQLEDGLDLVQIDKYYPLIHEAPALLTDYGFQQSCSVNTVRLQKLHGHCFPAIGRTVKCCWKMVYSVEGWTVIIKSRKSYRSDFQNTSVSMRTSFCRAVHMLPMKTAFHGMGAAFSVGRRTPAVN